MKELIQKIAKSEELQAKIKACEDAKSFASLLEIDEALAETAFSKVKEALEKDIIPDEYLEDVSGGCSGGNGCGHRFGINGFQKISC